MTARPSIDCLWFEEPALVQPSRSRYDPNNVPSRLCRAVEVLIPPGEARSTANYCLSLDRGYGHVDGQKMLAQKGVYSNSVMVTNRIGLPRKFLAELATDLSDCPPCEGEACSHGADATECRKFCFTALHKPATNAQLKLAVNAQPSAEDVDTAPWELACWQDSSLIVSLSNFFSSSRCGVISRGSSSSKHSYSVWAPEAIWHYNLLGRSATDVSDQLRKKMCLAERRIVRAGTKGITFVFDLAFTNASIMWRFVARDTVTSGKLDREYSKVRGRQS